MRATEESRGVFGAVSMSDNGDLWTVAQPIRELTALSVKVTKIGAVDAGWLEIKTGADPYRLWPVADRENPRIALSASSETILRGCNLENGGAYVQGTVTEWEGTGSVTVLINKIGLRQA